MNNLLEQARLREADRATATAAQSRADQVSTRIRKQVFMLDNFAREAKKAEQPAKKVLYLRKMADVLGPATAGIVPCRQGCSHCCNIPVLMNEAEARVIARETGREMAQVTAYVTRSNPAYVGTPCPFLKDGSCSIYEHRPFACRVQFNMDADDLLCRLVPGEHIEVPYFNNSHWNLMYLSAMQPNHEKLADIRDFFPTAV